MQKFNKLVPIHPVERPFKTCAERQAAARDNHRYLLAQ